MNHDTAPLVRRITPVTDARASALLTEETAADLARRITATDPAAPSSRPRARTRRRVPFALPLLAAGLAGAAVAVVLVARPEGSSEAPSPTRVTPGQVQLVSALSFTPKGDHLDVRIRDPYADPARYKEEFAAHGLDVDLSLVPVSPSIVGAVVMQDVSGRTRPDDFTDIRVKGACEVPSGGDDCTVGVRIRTDYRGSAAIVFGRAARPGEKYASTAQPDAPGEALHGLPYRGRPVSHVLAALKDRDVTVPEYRAEKNGITEARRPDQIPANWYVHDAAPWAAGQVLLFVGPEPTAEHHTAPAPIPTKPPQTNNTPGKPATN